KLPVPEFNTQTFPGWSPTQSSVPLLAVNTPSGPEVSGLGPTPANASKNCCVTPAPGFFASTTSIALLLRSAKKNLLSFGSNQLMSNEKNVPAVFEAVAGTCMTVVTLNTSSFLDEFPSSLSSVRAGAAIASMAMAPIIIPAIWLRGDLLMFSLPLICVLSLHNTRVCASALVTARRFETRRGSKSLINPTPRDDRSLERSIVLQVFGRCSCLSSV